MFLSRGDRDLGVAFQTHPGRQAFKFGTYFGKTKNRKRNSLLDEREIGKVTPSPVP